MNLDEAKAAFNLAALLAGDEATRARWTQRVAAIEAFERMAAKDKRRYRAPLWRRVREWQALLNAAADGK